MSQRRAYARWCPTEAPMQVGALLLLLAPVAPLSLRRALEKMPERKRERKSEKMPERKPEGK